MRDVHLPTAEIEAALAQVGDDCFSARQLYKFERGQTDGSSADDQAGFLGG